MLTSDLLRVRRKDREIIPRWLEPKLRNRLRPVATVMVDALKGLRGVRRDRVDEALDRVAYRPADRLIVQGLRKLLLDRCEFAVEPGIEPTAVREAVFRAAAVVRRQLGPGQRFDREAVLQSVAARMGAGAGELEPRLFADLRSNEQLVSFRRVSAEQLLDRYDVGLAQGVLLRATNVTIRLAGEKPAQARQLFRVARFHELLYRVHGNPNDGYVIELDGPLSLFSAVQRYGLKLALFLPAVLRCEHWRLQADLLWGRKREPMVFRLGPECRLVAPGRAPAGVSPALEQFCTAFAKLTSAWTVAPNERIFALPGEAVCIPDLVFANRETGEEVYLEAFGFWSRAAVWQRVETVARGFPARLILAVGKQLRVSEDVLGEQEAGQVYVYRANMSPRAVLERLESG